MDSSVTHQVEALASNKSFTSGTVLCVHVQSTAGTNKALFCTYNMEHLLAMSAVARMYTYSGPLHDKYPLLRTCRSFNRGPTGKQPPSSPTKETPAPSVQLALSVSRAHPHFLLSPTHMHSPLPPPHTHKRTTRARAIPNARPSPPPSPPPSLSLSSIVTPLSLAGNALPPSLPPPLAFLSSSSSWSTNNTSLGLRLPLLVPRLDGFHIIIARALCVHWRPNRSLLVQALLLLWSS